MRLVVDADLSGPLALLGGARQRAANPRPIMAMLARDLEDYERRQFATRGEGTWAADDSDTVEQKNGTRVLVDEGTLMRELTRARVSGDTVTVDQGRAFYGSMLRDGDRGMPRRNPAPMPQRRHIQAWADQVIGYILTGRTR